MSNDNFNAMSEHFALSFTPKIFDMMKELGFHNVEDLVKHIENYKGIKAEYAFLSGLLQGWEDALKDPNQLDRVLNDMIEMSKKLAEKGGIIMEKKKIE